VTSFDFFFIYENRCTVNVPSKSINNKILTLNPFFGILSAADEKAGSGAGSINQWYGSPDPDPYQDVTDPQHWFL
jgi:hypothetical protein